VADADHEPEESHEAEEPEDGAGPDQGLDVDWKGDAGGRGGGSPHPSAEPTEGQDGDRDPEAKERRRIEGRQRSEAASARKKGDRHEERERPEDPGAQAQGMLLGEAQDAGEGVGMASGTGAPACGTQGLFDRDDGPVRGRRPAPEASAPCASESVGTGIEAVGHDEENADRQGGADAQWKSREEPQDERHRQEEHEADDTVAHRQLLSLSATPGKLDRDSLP
jgi:hypothetical protein